MYLRRVCVLSHWCFFRCLWEPFLVFPVYVNHSVLFLHSILLSDSLRLFLTFVHHYNATMNILEYIDTYASLCLLSFHFFLTCCYHLNNLLIHSLSHSLLPHSIENPIWASFYFSLAMMSGRKSDHLEIILWHLKTLHCIMKRF